MPIPAARLSLAERATRPFGAMFRLTQSIDLDRCVHDLVSIRASQINGCAFCLDMHWQDARAAGAWNRLNAATRLEPGHYRPGAFPRAA